MLTIRFSRKGKKKRPFYRVIVSEKTKDTQADFVEMLGTYNPHTKEAVLKTDRIEYWIKNGAQTSASVLNLFVREGLMKAAQKGKAVRITKKRQAKMDEKNKAAEEAKAAAQATPAEATAPADAPAETPAEQPVAEEKAAEEKPAEDTQAAQPTEEKKEEAPAEQPAEEKKEESTEEEKK